MVYGCSVLGSEPVLFYDSSVHNSNFSLVLFKHIMCDLVGAIRETL